MDWIDIEAKLVERAEDVCRHLFPAGKRVGAEFEVGNLDGKEGSSLKVNLAGKVGVWRDFAGERGGKSLMSLWLHARNLPKFGAAVVEAKQFLGIADDFQKRVQAYPGPAERQLRPTTGEGHPPDDSAWKAVAEVWAKCQPLTVDGPVYEYLTKKRGLQPDVIEAFGVREFLSFGKWAMAFPYYATPAEGGKAPGLGRPGGPSLPGAAAIPEWIKFELLDRPNGKKREWTTKAPEKSLFGVQLAELPLFASCRHVLIGEGEKDAQAWATYGCQDWGILPLSVPFGAKWKGQDKGRPSPNREWLDRSWDWLQNFETVFICMDMVNVKADGKTDDSGPRAAADIIAEIGPRRCRLVSLPAGFKDPNECLQKGVAREAMHAAITGAQDFAPEKVVSAASLENEFMKWVFDRAEDQGIELPFDFPQVKLRRKEMILWMGVKGCGKSTLLGFVTVAAMAQGERVLVGSFEEPWEKTNDKLCRQAFGGFYFDKRVLKKCETDEERANFISNARQQTAETHRWLSKNLWYYQHVGIVHWRQLMDDMRWARRRLGITFFVVDNFMRLGISKDDYSQQADCAIAFAGLAMELDATIVLVIHQDKDSGKAKNRNKISGNASSASGAHEIGDNAATIIEVQRDDVKGKQMSELFEERKVAEQIGNFNDNEFAAKKTALDLKPDGKIILHNQRNGDLQDGSKHLWFLWESQQYVDCPTGHKDHAPIRFVANAHMMPKTPDLPTEEEINS